jgi:hypothetical protein
MYPHLKLLYLCLKLFTLVVLNVSILVIVGTTPAFLELTVALL